MELRYAGVLALFAAVSSQADNYQLELKAGWAQGTFEENFDSGSAEADYDGHVWSGTIYFSEVDTRGGPMREAAFLDKEGSFNVTRTDFSEEDDFGITTTNVSSRFLSDDYILELAFDRISYGGEFEDEEEEDEAQDHTFSLGFGTYLNDHSDIVATVSRSSDTDIDALAVNYHTVIQRGSSAWGFDLRGTYLEVPDESGYGLTAGAIYYPIPKLGIGANVDLLSIGDYETQTFTALAEYFINATFAGTLSYSYATEDDGSEIDNKLVTASITARF